MKERNEKIVEIILITICIISVVFVYIYNSLNPMLVSFIFYFLYKTTKEILIFRRRVKQKQVQGTAETILLSERVICYIILILVFLSYIV